VTLLEGGSLNMILSDVLNVVKQQF
jgi:hypothetical protein